ncbi:MAG: hypothetical protein HY718_00450 [Planctomycetes bacterium]|nr:hypothetical protein [Planctomycetota bacterium]
MPDILIRGLDAQTLKRLKARAKRHGRSLQSEAKLLLEQGTGPTREEIAAMLDRWARRFAGRQFRSSVALIREGRRR